MENNTAAQSPLESSNLASIDQRLAMAKRYSLGMCSFLEEILISVFTPLVLFWYFPFGL